MFDSQRHEFKGSGKYCEQCPQIAEHWVHSGKLEDLLKFQDETLQFFDKVFGHPDTKETVMPTQEDYEAGTYSSEEGETVKGWNNS